MESGKYCISHCANSCDQQPSYFSAWTPWHFISPSQHSLLQGSTRVLLHAVSQRPRLTPLPFSGMVFPRNIFATGQLVRSGGELEDNTGGLRRCPEMGYIYHFCLNFITQSSVTWACLVTEKCSSAMSLGGKWNGLMKIAFSLPQIHK